MKHATSDFLERGEIVVKTGCGGRDEFANDLPSLCSIAESSVAIDKGNRWRISVGEVWAEKSEGRVIFRRA